MRRWLIILCLLCLPALVWWRSASLTRQQEATRAATVDHRFTNELITILDVDRRPAKTFLIARLSSGAKLRLTASAYLDAQSGDIWLYSGQPTWPETPEPGKFDYGRWLKRHGFAGIDRGDLTKTSLPTDRSSLLARWLFNWRQRLLKHIHWLLPEPEASFLAGLLIGFRAEMPDSLNEQLRRTGTSHIIAVSGANVMIISGSVLWLSRFILWRRRPAFWLTLGAIWFFVLFTGASAAAARGGVTATLTTIAAHHGRSPPSGRLLWLTIWLMLIVNPFLYLDVGWQLSIAAFAGLLLLGPKIETGLTRLPNTLKQTTAETTAATLATMPISMISFGTFSLTGLLANPLILWIIPGATFAGLGALLITAIYPNLWLIARVVAWLPLHFALTTIRWLAPLPLSWQF